MVTALIILSFVVDWVGRRPLTRFGFSGASCCVLGVACWGRTVRPQGLFSFEGGESAAVLTALLAAASCFSASVWVAVGSTVLEAYPTVCRSTALGFGLCLVRISAFAVPSFVVPAMEADGRGGGVTFSVIAAF